MQKKEIINSIKIIVLALILTGAISYAWTAPGTEVIPPNDNVDRPINVGASDQDKVGGLSLGALLVTAGSQFNGELIVTSGNPSAGKVLTAVDGTGLVEWANASGAGGVKVYSSVSGTQQTITSTAWTDTGLSVTVTPSSASSKFLINANIIAMSSADDGNCEAGLFKGSTSLVAPFSSNDSSGWGAMPAGVTFVDNAVDTSARTYSIKVKNSSGRCFINRSQNTTSFSAVSSMSVLEVQ